MGGLDPCRDTGRGQDGGGEALTPLDRSVSEQAGPCSLQHPSCCSGVLKSDPLCSLFHPLLAFFFFSEKAPYKDL